MISIRKIVLLIYNLIFEFIKTLLGSESCLSVNPIERFSNEGPPLLTRPYFWIYYEC